MRSKNWFTTPGIDLLLRLLVCLLLVTVLCWRCRHCWWTRSSYNKTTVWFVVLRDHRRLLLSTTIAGLLCPQPIQITFIAAQCFCDTVHLVRTYPLSVSARTRNSRQTIFGHARPVISAESFSGIIFFDWWRCWSSRGKSGWLFCGHPIVQRPAWSVSNAPMPQGTDSAGISTGTGHSPRTIVHDPIPIVSAIKCLRLL